MKALEILNQQLRDETLWLDNHEEAIKELEEAMKPKSCSGCIYETKRHEYWCDYCSRVNKDHFKLKD